jgi:hypothetical protein
MGSKTTAAAAAKLMLLLLAAGHCLSAQAETLVAEYRGSMSRNTPEFEVQGPWILDWRITTDGSYESAVEVSLSSAGLGAYEGRILRTKQPGNGVRLFNTSGRYYLRVDASFANWHLKVIELSEEEAAEYTPRDG